MKRPLAALLLSLGAGANAAPVIYQFTGTITSVTSQGVSAPLVGTSFQGFITVNIDAPAGDTFTTANHGQWNSADGCSQYNDGACLYRRTDGPELLVSDFSLNAGSFLASTFDSEFRNANLLQRDDGLYQLFGSNSEAYTRSSSRGEYSLVTSQMSYVYLQSALDSAPANPVRSLPQIVDLSHWTVGAGTYWSACTAYNARNQCTDSVTQYVDIQGTMTSLRAVTAQSVPEPGGLSLSAAALLALAVVRRRKQA